MSYERCPKDVKQLVLQVMEDWHPQLQAAGVTVDALFCLPKTNEVGEETQGLKHGGYEAAAVTRIVGLKDRAKGCADIEIVFDQYTWDRLSEEEREALIDHELYHSLPATDQKGHPLEDQVGRPKLKARRHDRQFGWFDEIAKRRGRASFEVKQAMALVLSGEGQLYLPGIISDSVVALRTERFEVHAGGN